MACQSPPNLAVSQLLSTDLASKCSIRLVKDVLAADFDLGLQVFAHEEEEEGGWRNDYFCNLQR